MQKLKLIISTEKKWSWNFFKVIKLGANDENQ